VASNLEILVYVYMYVHCSAAFVATCLITFVYIMVSAMSSYTLGELCAACKNVWCHNFFHPLSSSPISFLMQLKR
jgi:hypothetical protein